MRSVPKPLSDCPFWPSRSETRPVSARPFHTARDPRKFGLPRPSTAFLGIPKPLVRLVKPLVAANDPDLAATQKSLAEARERLKALPETGETLPAGVEAAEGLDKRALLNRLVYMLEAMERSIKERQNVRATLEETTQRAAKWEGFSEPPPYSVLMVDGLESSVEAQRTRVEELTGLVAAAENQLDLVRNKARQAEQQERRAVEDAESAKDEVAKAASRWRLGLASLRREAEITALRTAEIGLAVTKVRLEQARVEAALGQRQFEQARARVRFNKDDLDAALKTIAQRKTDLDKDVAAARKRRQEFSDDDLAKLRARIEANTRGGQTQDRKDLDQALLRAAEARAQADRDALDVLESSSAYFRLLEEMWQARFAFTNDPEPAKRNEAAAKLKEMAGRIEAWSLWAASEFRVGQEAEREQEKRLDAAGRDTELEAAERAALEAARRRDAALQRFGRVGDDAARTARRWLAHLDEEKTKRPWRQAVGEWVSETGSKVRGIWTHEVFTVDDTVKVDGRETTIARGVTVGKFVVAAIILLGGFYLVRKLARRLQSLATRRFSMVPQQARLARRVVEAVALTIIVLTTLNMVRIPLTAFAFLGGALALGVGFGTQTVIKNLISGLIVLGERKVRLGDIVEIDNVVGTVTSIDVRSCTVLAFDGTESLIPNSFLLENRVNNWTYSSRHIRRSIRVGVAYGSPARQVADLLDQCARRHGIVLDDPKPSVIFEDFGENAMVFTLYFWVPLKPEVSATVVASDLRFMIDKSFAEAGLEMAFPQRDVRLLAEQAIPVRLARREGGS